MIKIEHIGIAVKDLSSSISLFESLLESDCYKVEAVESERVTTAFLRQGETKIELLESADSEGVIARFIEKKGEGLHHIAFEVDDILAEMERLKKVVMPGNPVITSPFSVLLYCRLHPHTE